MLLTFGRLLFFFFVFYFLIGNRLRLVILVADVCGG